jgi:FkbM family methyltransferase
MIHPKRFLWKLKHWKADKTISLETPSGIRWIGVYPNRKITNFYEQVVIEDVLSEFKSGDVFYDVGANFGRYTCLAGALDIDVSTYAIEPYPDNIKLLKNNIENNDTSAKCVESALSNEIGTVTMVSEDHPARNHLVSSAQITDGVKVPLTTGDELTSEGDFESPTVVKIDVEGAEYRVLDGWRESLPRSIRAIYIELHPFALDNFGASESDVFKLLTELGYSTEIVLQRQVTEPGTDNEQSQKIIKAT